ncbi:unnamed protein product [Sphagnum troendelagicum]|uniref:RNA polymerase sigma-70 region 4 domain-containing protein n=1 Tax=Sphagnum troendelagicum TaxID=128251 RepID=A0ABP0TAS6_9BRYO
MQTRCRITGKELVENLLISLKPKESVVLRQKFGLDGKGECSLEEIGQNLDLSREMVRRYEMQALLKLKHPTHVESLQGGFV